MFHEPVLKYYCLKKSQKGIIKWLRVISILELHNLAFLQDNPKENGATSPSTGVSVGESVPEYYYNDRKILFLFLT